MFVMDWGAVTLESPRGGRGAVISFSEYRLSKLQDCSNFHTATSSSFRLHVFRSRDYTNCA